MTISLALLLTSIAMQCSPGHVRSFQTNTQRLCAGMKAGLPLPYTS